MRQIKASEVKPGMTIRWTNSGLTQECTVGSIINRYSNGAVDITTPEDTIACVRCAYPVTVLSEAQPEEPVTLCARIVVAGRKIYRWTEDPKEPWPWQGEALNVDPGLWSWSQLCGLGPVTVVDADPSWTAPEQTHDTPEVPDRIEEWPEGDEALRPYPWREHCGYTWKWIAAVSEWECYDEVGNYVASGWRPSCGPWERDTDA